MVSGQGPRLDIDALRKVFSMLNGEAPPKSHLQIEAELKAKAAMEARYGSEESVFLQSESELRLQEFLKPLELVAYDNELRRSYVSGYRGHGNKFPVDQEFRAAMHCSISLPPTLQEMIDEWTAWDGLMWARQEFDRGYVSPHLWARMLVLETEIMEIPIRGWADMDARMKWQENQMGSGRWDFDRERAAHARLRADLAILQQIGQAASAQIGHAQIGHAHNEQRLSTDQIVSGQTEELE